MILPKYWKENLFSDFVKYIVLFPFKKFATTKNNYHPSKIKSSSKNGTTFLNISTTTLEGTPNGDTNVMKRSNFNNRIQCQYTI